MTDDTMIAALLREREGLARRGLPDRVAQVDEQLALRGYVQDPADQSPAPPPEGPPAPSEQPKGRRSARKETA